MLISHYPGVKRVTNKKAFVKTSKERMNLNIHSKVNLGHANKIL